MVDTEVLRQDYETNLLGIKAIARKHGLGHRQVRQRLVNAGVTIRGSGAVPDRPAPRSAPGRPAPGRPRIDLDTNTLRAAYEKGATVELLAQKYGVSAGTIRNRLKEAGARIRSSTVQKTHIVGLSYDWGPTQ